MRCDLIKTSVRSLDSSSTLAQAYLVNQPISDWKAVELHAGMEEPTETIASARAAQEAKIMRTSLRLYRLSVQCRVRLGSYF